MADDLVGRTWDCRATASAHSFTGRAYLPSGGRLRGCDRCVRGRVAGWFVLAGWRSWCWLQSRWSVVRAALAAGLPVVSPGVNPAVLAGVRAYAQPCLDGHDLVWLVARLAKTVSEG
jgi:hypothetical protein